jgi:hypothetical protein
MVEEDGPYSTALIIPKRLPRFQGACRKAPVVDCDHTMPFSKSECRKFVGLVDEN